MIEIKTAASSQAEMLALLGRQTYTESHGDYVGNAEKLFNYVNKSFSVAKVEDDLRNPDVIYHIAYYNELPVGYTKLVQHATHSSLNSGSQIRLERIYILLDFLHLKIGRMLMDHIMLKAAELKFDNLWLSVYIKNHRAIRFYEKNDFKIVGELNFMVDGKDYENHVLTKKL